MIQLVIGLLNNADRNFGKLLDQVKTRRENESSVYSLERRVGKITMNLQ